MVGSIEGSRRRIGAFAVVLVLAVLAMSTSASAVVPSQGGISSSPNGPTVLSPGARQVYPIRGAHEYWQAFGGPGGHEGVDIGARCGTPLVASQAGKVRFAKYHPRAGNYVVIDLDGSNLDLAYMHLTDPAIVPAGQSVLAGQALGTVGDSGNASGCHLHFEVWEGAWYGGGSPIDPMPFLAAWDKSRKRAAQRSSRF